MSNNFEINKDILKIKVEINEASLNDVKSIQELNQKLFLHEINEGFDDNLDSNWSISEEGKAEIQERLTNKENSCGFVVRVDDEIIGYLIGRILEEETGRAESRYAEIEHMFVDKNYQGMGSGKKLVQEFKNWAKNKDLKIIKTNVSYENKNAIAFYEKVGLIPSDITMTMAIE